MGTEVKSFFSTTVKSSFVSVNPVPHMTSANMRVMRSPLLVHNNRDGLQSAKIAPPRTKNGKPEVRVASVASRRLLLSLSGDTSSLALSDADNEVVDKDEVNS